MTGIAMSAPRLAWTRRVCLSTRVTYGSTTYIRKRATAMSFRIRHCVQCPRCQTKYLIGFSPYANGAYLVRCNQGSEEEYILYCFCERAGSSKRSRWSKLQECHVAKQAYARGYGSPREVWPTASELPPKLALMLPE